MPIESPPSDMKNVWQNQKTEGIQMSVDEIRRRAGKFHRKIFWRNAREYVAALAVTLFFGYEFWRAHDLLTHVGLALMIGGLVYMNWHLYKRGSSRSLPADLGLASNLEFHRRELERQRDLIGSVWSWYLGPVIPGWVVLTAAFARTNPGHSPHVGLSLTVLDTFGVLLFIFIWKLNQHGARRLQERIDELKALGG